MDTKLEKLEWPIVWGHGEPECTVIATWHQTCAIIPSQGDNLWNVISLKDCESSKYGGPNDEVIDAHPLAKHGLDCGAFYRLNDSSWKQGLEKINSTHSCFNPQRWSQLHHFILVLKETIFEFIAAGISVEQRTSVFSEIVSEVTQNLYVKEPKTDANKSVITTPEAAPPSS